MASAVVLGAGELGQHVQLEGGRVVAGFGQLFYIAACDVFELEIADGGVDGERIAVGDAELRIVAANRAVLGAGVSVALGVEENVGVGLAFARGERHAHGLHLRGGLGGLVDERNRLVQAAVSLRGTAGVAGELVGAAQGVAEVGRG